MVTACAGEAGGHAGASPAGRIGLFTTESWVREDAARRQRWLWRKPGCQQALWATNPQAVLRERYGLYRLPTRAAWTRAVASKRWA